MHLFKPVMLSMVTALSLAIALPSFADPQIEINSETEAFQDRAIAAGPIQVTARYEPFDLQSDFTTGQPNLHYQVLYNGALQLEATAELFMFGNIDLQDLDSDGTPEVIVETYSGGAHCCTNFTIHSWQDNQFETVETGLLDGGGGSFKDLNNDGLTEFVSSDNAFFYAFGSYAGSFPPSQIWTFQDGKLVNTTRQFPQELRSTAWNMYQAILEMEKDDYSSNGILASYVAQKILLGEYQQGWDFMLAHYDRTSDWGLAIYEGDEVVGHYPDFPTALEVFLIEQGYLNSQGEPISR